MQFKKDYQLLEPNNFTAIFSQPNWYFELKNTFNEYFYNPVPQGQRTKEWVQTKKEWLQMVTELFLADKIYLGKTGLDMDAERKPITTAVIHHSSIATNISNAELEALELIRLYAYEFANADKEFYGMPIWSGHFRNNKQTFIPYHYLVRNDGSFEQTLNDQYIGWHCGRWEINCQSIGICVMDDLENKKPTNKSLQTMKEIIKKYPQAQILGHREVKTTTSCPGSLFLGKNGWKEELLKEL